MSNIEKLHRDSVARRACGWHYGPDELPMRQGDPTSLQADALAEVSRVFVVDGTSYTLAEMLAANADDRDLCEWLVNATPGERFPAHLECRRAA